MAVGALKNLQAEKQMFSARLWVGVALLVAMTALLVGRLTQLQVLQFDYYSTKSDDNRMRLTVIPPVRGLIHDRNGALLAENVPSFVLQLVPERVPDLDATLVRLNRLVGISEQDVKRFRERMRKTPPYRGVALRTNLSLEEVARYELNRYEFEGVDIVAGLTRGYTLGASAAHAIGYIGGITENDLKTLDEQDYRGTQYVGRTGVERSHEELLHGALSTKIIETNAAGRPLRDLNYSRGAQGNSLYLSLDAQVQLAAEEAFGEQTGALVAIEPGTGEVLALLSKPGFDPHLFVDGIDPKSYRALNDDPDHPLFNRALQGQYAPGSTIKPFIALAALEYNLRGPKDREYCKGYFQLPGVERRYRCWKRKGHHWVDMDSAIVRSCDVYFYELAMKLGINRIHEFLSRFGLGQTTGIDLPVEKSGLLPSREWKRRVRNENWYQGETVNIGIGQGAMTMTPLQMAHMTARMAMRGGGFKPHMLHAVQDAATGELRKIEPEPLPRIELSDPDEWEHIIESMENVAHGAGGTAYMASYDAPYRIAAKTGTVQVAALSQEDEEAIDQADLARRLRDHALFVAFAPADDPKIALAVLVEHAGGGGGAIAAPIARKVMDTWLLPDKRKRAGPR